MIFLYAVLILIIVALFCYLVIYGSAKIARKEEKEIARHRHSSNVRRKRGEPVYYSSDEAFFLIDMTKTKRL